MILSCPSCSKRFMLDAALLGNGRRVKCGNCRTIWFQEPPPPEHPAHPSKMARKPAPPPPPPPPPPPFIGDIDDGIMDQEDTGGFSGFRDTLAEMEEEERRERMPRLPARPEDVQPPARWKAALPWAGLAAAVALIAGGLFQGRDAIVAAWPAANGFYELVGMPVEPLGAGLEPVYKAEFREVEGNPMLFISGEIRNVSDTVRDVPDLVATAIDPEGNRGQSWLIVPSARRIFPNQTATFSSIQPEGDRPTKEVSLVFQAPKPAR